MCCEEDKPCGRAASGTEASATQTPLRLCAQLHTVFLSGGLSFSALLILSEHPRRRSSLMSQVPEHNCQPPCLTLGSRAIETGAS